MERHDVSQKKHNTPNKPEKEKEQSNNQSNKRKRSPETEEKSIMEESDEETDGRFGVLGEKQVGVVILWELEGRTRKANGSEEEKVIGSLHPEEQVYNPGQQEKKCY
jgi:hypothetical protein